MSNFLSSEKLVKLADLASQGLSTREIAKRVGIAKNTVQRWIVILRPEKCYCGKKAAHRGWCWYRTARSPSRQAFLKTLTKIRPETLRFWESMSPSSESETAPVADTTDAPTAQP